MNHYNNLVKPQGDCQQLAFDFLHAVWNLNDTVVINELIAPTFFCQNTLRGEPFNKTQYLEFVQSFRRAMPDLILEIDEIMSKGDRVITNSLVYGTLTRQLFNIPPSDKIITFPAVSFLTIKQGMVADISTVIDVLDVEKQLGETVNLS